MFNNHYSGHLLKITLNQILTYYKVFINFLINKHFYQKFHIKFNDLLCLFINIQYIIIIMYQEMYYYNKYVNHYLIAKILNILIFKHYLNHNFLLF